VNNDEIMTLEEVAAYLKLKPQTVYKWAQEEQIPAAKLGKEWRFRKSMLDEWIDTAIVLSKGGFDLMWQASALAVRQKGLSATELDRLLEEVSAATSRSKTESSGVE
jgi:excisionase family DNA binding protein